MKEGINGGSFLEIARLFLTQVPAKELREKLSRIGIEKENIDKIIEKLNGVPSDATSGEKEE